MNIGSGHSTQFWSCPELWAGSSVVIIGGGPSLKGFDWEKLRSKTKRFRYIACNDAYCLGWPDLCFFGDNIWFQIHSQLRAFEVYSGLKVSMAFDSLGFPGVCNMERVDYNRHDPVHCFQTERHQLPWYGNTGISAIALAVRLGAKKIILMGFDMLPSNGQFNWYKNRKNRNQNPGIYKLFRQSGDSLAIALAALHPDVTVLNGTVDGFDSNLKSFSTLPWKDAVKA